jgi:hypothetical protein
MEGQAMPRQQPTRRGDQAQHIPRGDHLSRPVNERSIALATPATEAEKIVQERMGRARTARRDCDKLGDPARSDDEQL